MLRFSSSQEKRRIENLHKLFAITAALPALRPLVRRLLDLPSNDFFYSAFRAWYYICHVTDVMPRRPNLEQLMEGLLSVFGVYRGHDPNVFPIPEPDALPIVAGPAASSASSPQTLIQSAALTGRVPTQQRELLRVL